MAHVSVVTFDTLAQRDAGTGYDEGDLCYVKEDHTYYFMNEAGVWKALARAEDLP